MLAQLNLETGFLFYVEPSSSVLNTFFTLLGAIGALGRHGWFVDDSPTLRRLSSVPAKDTVNCFNCINFDATHPWLH